MLQHQPRRSHRRVLAFVLPLALVASLIPLAAVSAAASVTPATGGSSISADTNPAGSGAFTTLDYPAERHALNEANAELRSRLK